jgi:hypothetical protein
MDALQSKSAIRSDQTSSFNIDWAGVDEYSIEIEK